jgi:L-alanine-DL-glutamate epimerase-like enolase superfamily enzyme
MRITEVVATPFTLQRKTSVRTRTHQGAVSHHVLIEVRTDEGLIGRAEALSKLTIYGETQSSIVAIVHEALGPALQGLDPMELDEANRRLGEFPANNTTRAAVDIALHDLVGQQLGVPLYQLWGGHRTEQEVSWTVGLRRPEQMATEAEDMNRLHGINAFKLKGGRSPDDDVESVRLVRGRLPAAQISLDANEGYTAKVAIRALERMAPYDLAYVEEPIPRHDRRGRLEAARRIPMPMLGDDSCFTLADVARELDLGAIGLVSIKTPRTGFWESFKILAAAEAHGVGCIVGIAAGGAFSSAAALHFSCSRASLRSPSENSFSLNLQNDISRSLASLQDGRLRVPIGPGLGIKVLPEDLSAVTSA